MNRFLLTLIACVMILFVSAQPGKVYTKEDYQHAESMMGYSTQQYVDRGNVIPNWMAGDKFWYRVLTAKGSEFVVVDPAKGIRTTAFNHQKLAEALSKAIGRNYTAETLPFQSFSYATEGNGIIFRADSKQWKYDLQTGVLANDTSKVNNNNMNRPGGGFRGGRTPEVLSPDRSKAVFIKDYNLWVRDIKTNEQKQLTTDGIKDFGYATDNAGWTSSDGAIVRWSPDSKKVATFKQDQRNVGDMYLASTNALLRFQCVQKLARAKIYPSDCRCEQPPIGAIGRHGLSPRLEGRLFADRWPDRRGKREVLGHANIRSCQYHDDPILRSSPKPGGGQPDLHSRQVILWM